MANLTGVVVIKVNGTKMRSDPGATLKPGGKIGEAVNDDGGFQGVATKEVKGSEVKWTMTHGDDVDVTSLQNLRGVTLVFETDSGQSYLCANAGTVGEVELKGNKVDITMAGDEAELM